MGNDVVRSECCGLDNVDVNDAILQKLGRKIRQVLPTLLYVDAAGGK